MKLLGLFITCFAVICLGLAIFANLIGNIWGLIALPALLMAIIIRMYMELDERLDRIEEQLGIKEKEEQPFSEKLKEGEK